MHYLLISGKKVKTKLRVRSLWSLEAARNSQYNNFCLSSRPQFGVESNRTKTNLPITFLHLSVTILNLVLIHQPCLKKMPAGFSKAASKGNFLVKTGISQSLLIHWWRGCCYETNSSCRHLCSHLGKWIHSPERGDSNKFRLSSVYLTPFKK